MPLSTIQRVRLDKAAVDEGFGLQRPDDGDWMAYDGLGTPASIRLTQGEDGAYAVAVDHPGAARDLAERWTSRDPDALPVPPAGFSAFAVRDTTLLHRLVREIRRLARSLPVAPLRTFEAQTKAMPRTTEAERLVIQRVGQDVFRAALMTYWGGQCAVTGIADPRLLRASHIKPWARCDTDAERLDVHNGLLLAAHLDAAFDAGLVSFNDSGSILFAVNFLVDDRVALGLHADLRLTALSAGHRTNLAWHRSQFSME